MGNTFYSTAQSVVVVQIPEWKFEATMARNACTFEGCLGPNFCLICIKNGKKN